MAHHNRQGCSSPGVFLLRFWGEDGTPEVFMDVGATDAAICHLDSYFVGKTFSILDVSYIFSSSMEDANVCSHGVGTLSSWITCWL